VLSLRFQRKRHRVVCRSTLEAAGALDKLEAFASFYDADYCGLPRNKDTITLRREEWEIPASVGFGEHRLVPLRAGEKMKWKLM
jgi:dihydroorotase